MKTTDTTYTGRELRWLADAYEQAQRIRIETGERIRAVLQGRDETFTPVGQIIVEAEDLKTSEAHERADQGETPELGERAVANESPEARERAGVPETPAPLERAESLEAPEGSERSVFWIDPEGWTWTEPDEVLRAVAKNETLGPVPILGRTYQRHHTEERELYREMMGALRSHPAWPWLDRVKGIGPTLGCKLLARLDATKADHASSFWAYCGLATVPADVYRCDTCNIERAWPTGYNVTGKHQALGSNRACKGSLVKVAGPEDGARCAQPRSARGEKATYDSYAKKVLYLVATSFLKAGGPYEEFYRRERAKAERERPTWADGRKHYLALRKVQKLFLSHLWQVWREALDMPVGEPWAHANGRGHGPSISPQEMV